MFIQWENGNIIYKPSHQNSIVKKHQGSVFISWQLLLLDTIQEEISLVRLHLNSKLSGYMRLTGNKKMKWLI